MMKIVSVNAAWPAPNDTAAGASPASRIANGSTNHSSVWLVPISHTSVPPATSPTTVPPIARTIVWPVLRALERSTESVPSTIQNECCAPLSSATRIAIPSPAAPRTLLRSQMLLRSKWAVVRSCTAATVLGNPAGGRPSSRCHQVRRSAAAAAAALAPSCSAM